MPLPASLFQDRLRCLLLEFEQELVALHKEDAVRERRNSVPYNDIILDPLPLAMPVGNRDDDDSASEISHVPVTNKWVRTQGPTEENRGGASSPTHSDLSALEHDDPNVGSFVSLRESEASLLSEASGAVVNITEVHEMGGEPMDHVDSVSSSFAQIECVEDKLSRRTRTTEHSAPQHYSKGNSCKSLESCRISLASRPTQKKRMQSGAFLAPGRASNSSSAPNHHTVQVRTKATSEYSRRSADEDDNDFEMHPLWEQGLVPRRTRKSHGRRSQVVPSATNVAALEYNNSQAELQWLKDFIWSPSSVSRMSWDFVGGIFLMWDIAIVPLGFITEDLGSAVSVIERIVPVYWTIDFITQFFTGYIASTGTEAASHKKIILHYARTWMIFDLFVVTVDWISFATDENNEGSILRGASRFFKSWRILRLARVARFAALVPEVVNIVGSRIRSENIKVLLHMSKNIGAVLILVHIIACFWYAIGDSEDGWVTRYAMKNDDLSAKYAASYHWTLTQFMGSTDINPKLAKERFFALVVIMVAFIGSAAVVSSLTSSMTQLSIISARAVQQISLLKRYLLEKNISPNLALRVERNAEFALEKEKQSVNEEQVELLALVSTPLRIELSYEINGEHLKCHPFFEAWSKVNAVALKQTCHTACTSYHLYQGDILFSEGEISDYPAMKVVLAGSLMYYVGDQVEGTCEARSWVAEAALWTNHWAHRGTCRVAFTADLLNLDARSFQHVANKFRLQTFYPALYARSFVGSLSCASPAAISDLNKPEVVNVQELVDDLFSADPEFNVTHTPSHPKSKLADLVKILRTSNLSRHSKGAAADRQVKMQAPSSVHPAPPPSCRPSR